MCNLLEVRGLRGGYGGREILHGLSFSLAAGQVCALLGPNGSGKSTLLRGICGLIPLKGSCCLEGQSLEGMPAHRRAGRMAYLPQRRQDTLALTALETVLLGYHPLLGPFERPSPAQRAHALEVLDQLGAGDLSNENFLSLSEGQRQLVLLARTLVRPTRLLVLDEPDAPLDYPRRRQVMAFLGEQAARWNAGVLWCTHDISLALNHAHRLLFLKDGHLAAQAEPSCCGEEELAAALKTICGPVEVFSRGGRYLITEVENP